MEKKGEGHRGGEGKKAGRQPSVIVSSEKKG
jgi:hypothetical protein